MIESLIVRWIVACMAGAFVLYVLALACVELIKSCMGEDDDA